MHLPAVVLRVRRTAVPAAAFHQSRRARRVGMAATMDQLSQLKQMSDVVADTGDIADVKKYQPVDCTTNPSLVLKAVKRPEYAFFLKKAIEAETGNPDCDSSRPFSGVVDRLIVDMGAEILNVVTGRVSTEVDAHLSYDTEATVAKARRIIELYKEKGIGPERVYIKIASTWEGIQACAQLEREGINCNMTLLFSFAQGGRASIMLEPIPPVRILVGAVDYQNAVACASAKASLISPILGRIMDWYTAKTGKVYPASEDPGVLQVQRIYRYFKKYGIQTIVMAASFRNVNQIRELAGCDKITIGPKFLEELAASTDDLPRKLSRESAGDLCEDEELASMDQAMFKELHESEQMAVDKLKDGIDGFAADQEELESLLATVAKEQKLRFAAA